MADFSVCALKQEVARLYSRMGVLPQWDCDVIAQWKLMGNSSK